MTSRPFAAPLRPDYSAVRRNAEERFTRAVVAELLGYVQKTDPEKIIERNWSDAGISMVLRAATQPASLSASTWGEQLAGTSTADILATLGPPSAGVVLLQRGFQLQLGRPTTSVNVPAIISDPNNILFVAEKAALQVRDYSVALAAQLPVRRAGVICVFTQEMFRYSVPAIEDVVRNLVSESFNLKIDANMLDNAADDGVRPKGLLNSIVATTASTTTATETAMHEDLSKLVGLVSAVAGNGPIILVGAPRQAARMKLSRDITAACEILNSPALADKTVIAIAANALVSISSGAPRFEVRSGPTLHMSTTPAELLASGTGPTVAASPTRSLYQTDCVALKMVFMANWALRSASVIAFMNNVVW